MNPPLSFRAVRPKDEDFLYRLFSSLRIDITLANMPDVEKQRLMRMQFDAQTLHYTTHFGDADFLIILQGKHRIGRLTVLRAADEFRVVDIALLPDYRGKGYGTKVMQGILDEARVADKPVRLHAEKQKRVVEFYQRLGFKVIAEKELHFFMECSPGRRIIA